jgi:hypothetical protein
VVLLLSFGCRARWFGAHGVPTAPAPAVQPASFPKAAPFVPQKTVAMQRAKLLVALGGAAGVAGALFALSRWLL